MPGIATMNEDAFTAAELDLGKNEKQREKKNLASFSLFLSSDWSKNKRTRTENRTKGKVVTISIDPAGDLSLGWFWNRPDFRK